MINGLVIQRWMEYLRANAFGVMHPFYPRPDGTSPMVPVTPDPTPEPSEDDPDPDTPMVPPVPTTTPVDLMTTSNNIFLMVLLSPDATNDNPPRVEWLARMRYEDDTACEGSKP